MPISARYPSGRSQHFTFPRREFLQRLASAALLSGAYSKRSTVKALGKYSVSGFRIGDIVRSSWLGESGEERSEVGEVVGLCWHPLNNRWEYLIFWFCGESDDATHFRFDEHLTDPEGLERTSYA
jgi:hypothetical protein